MLPRIHFVLAVFLLSIAILKTTGSNAQCTVRAVVTPASCSGQSDGSITLQVTGTSPYKFEWSNGANTQNITSLTAGNYRVKVTDAKGQEGFAEATVAESQPLMVQTDIKPTSLSKKDGSVIIHILQADGVFTYQWFNLQTNQKIAVSDKYKNTLTGLAPGSYAVSVRNAQGCRKTIEFEIK